MVTNRLFTAGEIITISTNIREIERTLGGSIPGGLIDVSDLKDHILSPGEVVTICNNLSHFKRNVHRYNRSNNSSEGNIALSFLILTIVGTILLIIETIFNIKIL